MTVLTPRARLGRARRLARAGRYLGRRRVTPYVGWTGEGNLGDEAMFEAHQLLLPELAFLAAPTVFPPRIAEAVASAPWLTCEAVCLGGGTLVGNGHFRGILESVQLAWPDAPRFVLGVGVEDPDYVHGRRGDVHAELERWGEILRPFAVVGVRGPLSQAALADVGVESVVVGDPALALLPADALAMPEEGLIALNVGVVDDQWGMDPAAFVEAFTRFCRSLLQDGRELLFVPTTRQDAAFQRQLAAGLGPGATCAPFTDAAGVMVQMARARVVVAHKLHALVLAAAAGVPGIALEYRPKCRDFQASVGRAEHVMRTDQFDGASLVQQLDAVAADAAQAAALERRVDELRGALQQAAHSVTEVLRSRARS